MDDTAYYCGTTVLIGLTVVAAIFIEDPAALFEVLSGPTASLYIFIMPAILYLIALNEYQPENTHNRYRVCAVLMLTIGILYFVLCTLYSLRSLF
jgi:hypothetical protein